ncbi:hypothetical protein DsansV1_C01g0005001 [Dioscorea sansibarensis]
MHTLKGRCCKISQESMSIKWRHQFIRWCARHCHHCISRQHAHLLLHSFIFSNMHYFICESHNNRNLQYITIIYQSINQSSYFLNICYRSTTQFSAIFDTKS